MKRAALISALLIVMTLSLFMGTGWNATISHIYPGVGQGADSPKKIDIWEKSDPILKMDYGPLKEKLSAYLAGQPGAFSVYFKDLHSGEVFTLNGDEPVTAASTVKVPAVLYLYTLIAQGKLNWDERVIYNSQLDYQDGAGVLQFSARDGDGYSLRVLANLSITVSDNIAYRMLVRHLGKDNLAAFMRNLGGKTVFPEGRNITTAVDMGKYIEGVLLFREKYPELGDQLLDDMAHSIYHVGLPGKLPKNLKVSHKEGDVLRVANDAGIVFSEHPYILVVLSKDVDDLDAGFARIADISKIVYDYQEQLFRNMSSS